MKPLHPGVTGSKHSGLLYVFIEASKMSQKQNIMLAIFTAKIIQNKIGF